LNNQRFFIMVAHQQTSTVFRLHELESRHAASQSTGGHELQDPPAMLTRLDDKMASPASLKLPSLARQQAAGKDRCGLPSTSDKQEASSSSSIMAQTTSTAAEGVPGGSGVSAAALPFDNEDGWNRSGWGSPLQASARHSAKVSEKKLSQVSGQSLAASEVASSDQLDHVEEEATDEAQQPLEADVAEGLNNKKYELSARTEACSTLMSESENSLELQAAVQEPAPTRRQHTRTSELFEIAEHKVSPNAESLSEATVSTPPVASLAADTEAPETDQTGVSREASEEPSGTAGGASVADQPASGADSSRQAEFALSFPCSTEPPGGNCVDRSCEEKSSDTKDVHGAAVQPIHALVGSSHGDKDIDEAFVEAEEVDESARGLSGSSSTGTPSAVGSGAGGHTASEWSLVSAAEAPTGMRLQGYLL
jgi:hypothetical protein